MEDEIVILSFKRQDLVDGVNLILEAVDLFTMLLQGTLVDQPVSDSDRTRVEELIKVANDTVKSVRKFQ